jgi:sialidase-1
MDGTGANGTWGTIRVVANETGHTIGNPSPVVDVQGSGRIFCHFARDNADAFVSHSDDEGLHWAPPRPLDATVKYPGSGWYGSGVGGGIQLPGSSLDQDSDSPGSAMATTETQSTLMILAEERLGPAYNSVPITSSTGGATWQRGPYLNDPHNKTHGLGEPSVALVPGLYSHLTFCRTCLTITVL